MKKLDERSDWEKEWESSFNGASLPPSENVWNGIDGALDRQEVRKYKKRALFYQWVAAASVLLVMGLSGWLMLDELVTKKTEQLVAEEELLRPSASKPTVESTPAQQEVASARTSSGRSEVESESASSSSTETTGEYKAAEINPSTIATAKERENSSVTPGEKASGAVPFTFNPSTSLAEVIVNKAVSGWSNLAEKGKPSVALVSGKAFIEDDPFKELLKVSVSKVWVASEMLKEEEEDAAAPKYWLGASLASNLYQPNFENDEYSSFGSLAARDAEPKKGNQVSTARVGEWQEEQEQQVSINAGFQAAAWLGEKWVLQGGLQYGTYRSSATAGTFVDGASGKAFPLHYANFSYDKLQSASPGSRLAAPVSAVNTFEFISVPMQIGYVVFDRQFGLLLSPGVSSEFFIRNRITDQNDRLNTYTINAGEDAPFNRVHFKAVLGAQLYYKLGEHYMISLEPSFQQAITNFSKSSSYFNSRPSNIGVAAGFRYLFR